MKAHDLAKLFLEGPNIQVWGYAELAEESLCVREVKIIDNPKDWPYLKVGDDGWPAESMLPIVLLIGDY
jgi:hypothetical protein